MSPKNKQNGNTAMDAIIAIILFAALAFGSLQLKINGFIGEASLVSLLLASLISGFIVYFRKRLKKASFTSGIELQEIRETEKSIKELAGSMLELMEANEKVTARVIGPNLRKYEAAKVEFKKLLR